MLCSRCLINSLILYTVVCIRQSPSPILSLPPYPPKQNNVNSKKFDEDKKGHMMKGISVGEREDT